MADTQDLTQPEIGARLGLTLARWASTVLWIVVHLPAPRLLCRFPFGDYALHRPNQVWKVHCRNQTSLCDRVLSVMAI